jgi:hypothetical protein
LDDRGEETTGKQAVWSGSTVGAILRNPIYFGDRIPRKTIKVDGPDGKRKRVRNPDNPKPAHDESLRIIDDDLKADAEAARARKQKYDSSNRGSLSAAREETPKYAFSYLIRCWHCKASVMTHAQENEKIVYVCARHKASGTAACANNTRIPDVTIQARVITCLVERLSDPQSSKSIYEEIVGNLINIVRDTHELYDLESINAQIDRIRTQEERYADCIGRGIGKPDIILKRLIDSQKTREDLEIRKILAKTMDIQRVLTFEDIAGYYQKKVDELSQGPDLVTAVHSIVRSVEVKEDVDFTLNCEIVEKTEGLQREVLRLINGRMAQRVKRCNVELFGHPCISTLHLYTSRTFPFSLKLKPRRARI